MCCTVSCTVYCTVSCTVCADYIICNLCQSCFLFPPFASCLIVFCISLTFCVHPHLLHNCPSFQEKFYAVRPKDTYFKLYPPQWIDCDIRYLDFSILGKFAVIMADPPWDIHMELPYGTMSDDEMRCLKVPMIQDEGVIFLWVTGRAMELGRECLTLWGYDRVDEMGV